MKSLIVLCVCCAVGAFAATISPIPDVTSEEPTIGPIPAETTGPLPVSLLTEGTTPAVITINPATEASSLAPTIGPATVSTQTAMTIMPVSGSSSNPKSTTAAPQPTPAASESKFDGGSFGGGIALGLGLSIIAVVAYWCYSRRGTRGYDTM